MQKTKKNILLKLQLNYLKFKNKPFPSNDGLNISLRGRNAISRPKMEKKKKSSYFILSQLQVIFLD
jgi:hypothetical protein